jgi:hypothetical protein
MAYDFSSVVNNVRNAIAEFGSPAEYQDKAGFVRTVTIVPPYRERTEMLVEDVHSAPATALLNPAEFSSPPEQFETLRIDIDGFTRTYAIEDVKALLAGTKLAAYQVTLKGG